MHLEQRAAILFDGIGKLRGEHVVFAGLAGFLVGRDEQQVRADHVHAEIAITLVVAGLGSVEALDRTLQFVAPCRFFQPVNHRAADAVCLSEDEVQSGEALQKTDDGAELLIPVVADQLQPVDDLAMRAELRDDRDYCRIV